MCYGGRPGRTNKVPGHEALLAELCLWEIWQGSIRDCCRMTLVLTGKPEVNGETKRLRVLTFLART